MNYEYLDSNDQPAGPVSLEAIRALARAGTIAPNPQVRAEGTTEWHPLSSLPPAPPPPPPASGPARATLPAGTLLGDFVGALLKRVTTWLSPTFLDRSLAFARTIGQYAVLVGGALTVLYAVVAAIRYNSFALFLTGLVLVAAVAVAQFTAGRFLGAGDKLIATTTSRIASPAFLECTGLLVVLLAAATVLGALAAAIRVGSVAPLVPGLVIGAALTYFGTLALHPELVEVTLADGTAGEEAIGLLCFFFKSGLKLVPLFFLLLAVVGDLALLSSFFRGGEAFAGLVAGVLGTVPGLANVPYGFGGSVVVVLACLLPLCAYFIFLLQYLFVDVLRAILAVPAKLDALRH